MLDLQLEGQVAIVTGANRGLGQAMALALIEQGVQVLATDRTLENLEKMEDLIPGKMLPVLCDMKDTEAVAKLPDQAIEAFGQLDIIVNNAGIAPACRFLEQDFQVWNDTLAINVTALAILANAAGKHMWKQASGKIINIASTSGILGKPLLVGYSSSKGAVLQFTKALAGEWARKNIQVNAIAPGAFVTEAQSAVLESPEILARRLGKIPAKRMAKPEEIGPLVCYLASPLSNFITGSVFVMDGGESSKL